MNLLHKFFLRRGHYHIIKPVDYARGVPLPASVPLTAWRWRCVLCGRELDEINPSGIQQIANGEPPALVLRWTKERQK